MPNEPWYYARGDQQAGPVSHDELRQIARQGGLGPHDLVWTASMVDWQPAHTVPGILPAAPLPPAARGLGGPPPTGSPPAVVPRSSGGGWYPPGQHPPANDLGQDAGARWLLPVGRSGWAIAAGYLGLISVLLFPAPLALLFGILAVRDMKRNPQRHGMGRATFGIVMGAIFSCLLVVMLVSLGAGRRH